LPEVFAAGSNVFHPAAEFIIDPRMPVGHEYDEIEASLDHVDNLSSADKPHSNVHHSAGFEAPICPWVRIRF
jgi:hypothetical protein